MLELGVRECEAFQPDNPTTKEKTGEVYPVSTVEDVEEAVEAAAVVAEQIAEIGDEIIAQFLERFAERIEARGDEICQMAFAESGRPSRRASKISSCCA